MQIAVELSLYPLQQAYGPPILRYIESLKKHPNIEMQTNRMSTQLRGEFEEVMQAVQAATRQAFESEESVVLVMKAVNVVL